MLPIAVWALVVEPVGPFRGGQFNVRQAVPGLAGLDQLRLVEADLGLHERVVRGVADGADRGVDAGVDKVRGERERCVLTARIGMVNQCRPSGSSSPIAPP